MNLDLEQLSPWRSKVISIDRLRRFVIAALFAMLPLSFDLAAQPPIIPLRTSATFSSRTFRHRWSVPIKSNDGRTMYVLFLEPTFDVGHHVATVELVLRRPDEKKGAANLLAPSGNWHGLQPYDFPATDLAQGVKKSVFGEKRTIVPQSLGIVLQITISNAQVSPISGNDYQLDALEIQIEVENSKL
jgi:hypothetical protein